MCVYNMVVKKVEYFDWLIQVWNVIKHVALSFKKTSSLILLYIRHKEIWKYPKLLYPVEFTKHGMSVLNLDIPLFS